MDFTYKSGADEIKEAFGLSKKSYKAALTKLIESGKIELFERHIKIKSNT